MSQFASMYTSVDEIIVEGEDYGKTQLPLSYDRSCELAVECWQLRRELADRQVKQSDSEAFAAKLQKDINRLKNNADVQRLDIKEKEKTIFDLSNTVLDQNTRITNLEVSLNGVTGTLRRKNAELSAAAKKYKSLEDELSEYREKRWVTAVQCVALLVGVRLGS
jgi:chromosome segregation ATPase